MTQPQITLGANDTLWVSPMGPNYQWYFNGQPQIASNYIVSIGNGVYTVSYTDTNGCTTNSNPFNMFSTSINSKITFQVYPNPFTDEITINYPLNFNYTILDLKGSVLKTGKSNKINLKDLSSGNYILQIESGNEIFRRIITKE